MLNIAMLDKKESSNNNSNEWYMLHTYNADMENIKQSTVLRHRIIWLKSLAIPKKSSAFRIVAIFFLLWSILIEPVMINYKTLAFQITRQGHFAYVLYRVFLYCFIHKIFKFIPCFDAFPKSFWGTNPRYWCVRNNH